MNGIVIKIKYQGNDEWLTLRPSCI